MHTSVFTVLVYLYISKDLLVASSVEFSDKTTPIWFLVSHYLPTFIHNFVKISYIFVHYLSHMRFCNGACKHDTIDTHIIQLILSLYTCIYVCTMHMDVHVDQ